MNARFLVPFAGLAVAIAITATLDGTGLTVFSALPLLPLGALFWFLEHLSRREMGFSWGAPRYHGLALLYPVVVLGVVAAIAVRFGGAHIDATHASHVVKNLAILIIAGLPIGLVTEEGFFRGWLWASLSKRGMSPTHVLLVTSVAFALWHISYVTLATGYTLPPMQAALFILNAAIMGVIWGRMRQISGSIGVSTVCHTLWNAGAYTFFGEGPKPGAFGALDTFIFAPEIGVVGLIANIAFSSLLLWRSARDRG